MLKAAIDARIPLIRVESTDPVYLDHVIVFYIGREIKTLNKVSGKLTADLWKGLNRKDTAWWDSPPENTRWADVYTYCQANKVSLIVSNCDPNPRFFEAGELLIPDQLIAENLEPYLDAKDIEPGILRAFRGLTLKEVHEVVGLATAQYGELTPFSVSNVRRRLRTLPAGLQLVEPLSDGDFYVPDYYLKEWMALDGALFLADVPRNLRPRGLLFKGVPGTGKTLGAKYLSQQLQIPLYHLNIAGILQKYVGESERNLQQAFDQLQRLEPCIVLIDEVEKIFVSNSEDGGVSSRVLSMLLWWLQEHDLQVLTVMTTNDENAIPKELIRPGRIDEVYDFRGLSGSHSINAFIDAAAKSYAPHVKFSRPELDKLKGSVKSSMTQAKLMQIVRNAAKRILVNGLKQE